MEISSLVGLSHLTALQRSLEVITDNMTQINSPGVLQEDVMFSAFLDPSKEVSFVQDIATSKKLTPAALHYTGDPLHVGNAGTGWFSVQTPDGTLYTRNGLFTLNNEGQLISSIGNYPILNEGGGPITIPANQNVQISDDGTVSTQQGIIDKIGVFAFENPYNITRGENNLYSTKENPTPAKDTKLTQGTFSGSNIDPITETNKLILVNRMYQSQLKLLENQNRLESQTTEKLLTVTSAA